MQMISIKQIPIVVEYTTTRAQLRTRDPSTIPSYEMKRARGGFQISQKNIKMRYDGQPLRDSIGMRSRSALTRKLAQDGMQAASEATARYAEEGDLLSKIHIPSNPFGQIAINRTSNSQETALAFSPEEKGEISWEPNELNIRYTPDQLQFDWNVHIRPELEYVPYKFDFIVKQWPQVIIEYLGGHMYFPSSVAEKLQG